MKNQPPCESTDCSNTAARTSDGYYRKKCHKCRSRQYKKNNPLNYHYIRAKANAKYRAIPFKLTLKQYEQVWKDSGKWEKKLAGADWSMDRIDNNRGYEIGNVRIISIALNVEVWWNEDRWSVDFRWRKMWSERNGKPIEHCPF